MAVSTNLEQSLLERWIQLTSGIDTDIQNKWWETIRSKYTEPRRKYHNLAHLQKMFEHLDYNHGNINSLKALSYAIFFHDLEYDVRSQSNEEDSIELFQNFCMESKILQEEEELISEVTDLILLSKTHCTEAHISEDVYGNDDRHYFLDFDVSILGVEREEYREYAEQIRKEYEHLPTLTYNNLRKKVLKSFLQIPNIFATKTFRDKYEEQARKNITAEISELSENVTNL